MKKPLRIPLPVIRRSKKEVPFPSAATIVPPHPAN
jgi:hypothetical protein